MSLLCSECSSSQNASKKCRKSPCGKTHEQAALSIQRKMAVHSLGICIVPIVAFVVLSLAVYFLASSTYSSVADRPGTNIDSSSSAESKSGRQSKVTVEDWNALEQRVRANRKLKFK